MSCPNCGNKAQEKCNICDIFVYDDYLELKAGKGERVDILKALSTDGVIVSITRYCTDGKEEALAYFTKDKLETFIRCLYRAHKWLEE